MRSYRAAHNADRMLAQHYTRDAKANADKLREALLAEADLLIAFGSPIGFGLAAVADKLPLASLERIAKHG